MHPNSMLQTAQCLNRNLHRGNQAQIMDEENNAEHTEIRLS